MNLKASLLTIVATAATVPAADKAAALSGLGPDFLQNGLLGGVLLWVLRELVAKRLDRLSQAMETLRQTEEDSQLLMLEVVTSTVDMSDDSDDRIRNLGAVLRRVEERLRRRETATREIPVVRR